jgi:hypothetical protein
MVELKPDTQSQPLPRWFVSSPHRVRAVNESGPRWLPYGKQHAREVGAIRTVCGQYALGWPYIWELAFDMARDAVCTVCLEKVIALSGSAPVLHTGTLTRPTSTHTGPSYS